MSFAPPPELEHLLAFWFGPADAPEFGQPRSIWFTPDPAFDAELAEHFGDLQAQAAAGQLASWQTTPLSCLGLVLLLDQLPRNLFRGTARAFATDAQALAVAEGAIAAGFDRDLLPVQRWFLYLPYEHSERLADQERSLALWQGLQDDPASADAIAFAHRHWEIIDRFGRFPHRNALLNRPSRPEELAFLQQPNSAF